MAAMDNTYSVVCIIHDKMYGSSSSVFMMNNMLRGVKRYHKSTKPESCQNVFFLLLQTGWFKIV